MRSLLFRCFSISIFVLLTPVNVLSEGHHSFFGRYEQQRQVFLELQENLAAGKLERVKARIKELDGYPLQAYLDFLVLQKEIKQHSQPASLLKVVEDQSTQARLHRKLVGSVKNRSAALDRWQDYAKAASAANAPVHPCDDLMSRIKNGASVDFDEPVSDLWVEISKHTNRCKRAFGILLENVDDVPTAALWRRTTALLKRGDTESAGALLKYFNQRDMKVVEAWIDGIESPDEVLQSKVIRGNSPYHQQMATTLLRRWARTDLLAATEFWRQNGQHFGFNKKSVNEVLAKYAVLAAKRGMSESSSLLVQTEADRDVRYWRVRQALLKGQWEQCLVFIDALMDKEQAQARWQYWRGRCLESQGFKAAADRTYRGVASEFDYYGFLAADRIGKEYSLDTSQPLVNEAELKSLRDSKDLALAIEYFLVDLPWEGRREWNKALKSSSKQRYIAAASVAESLGWHDRALTAMRLAGEKQALATLYPLPHRSYVGRLSKKHAVSREHIYGVMRRESLFIRDIKSSAGAVGLMQLMPATAKQVGKQLGIKAPKWKLIDGELNMRLGTKYLNYLSKRFDGNIVLSTAAYNAGPTRVSKWMVSKPIAADIWVETIPYDETRDYVKAVLFNSVVYDSLLGGEELVRLREKMPDLVPPQ